MINYDISTSVGNSMPNLLYIYKIYDFYTHFVDNTENNWTQNFLMSIYLLTPSHGQGVTQCQFLSKV